MYKLICIYLYQGTEKQRSSELNFQPGVPFGTCSFVLSQMNGWNLKLIHSKPLDDPTSGTSWGVVSLAVSKKNGTPK